MDIAKLIIKLQEAIDDTGQKLYEFASPLTRVRERFLNLAPEIWEHTIKLIFYYKGNEQQEKHWAKEINAWLNKCILIKITKRKNPIPTQQEIYNWLTKEFNNSDDISNIISFYNKEYYSLNYSFDFIHNTIKQAIKEYSIYLNRKDINIDKVVEICKNIRQSLQI